MLRQLASQVAASANHEESAPQAVGSVRGPVVFAASTPRSSGGTTSSIPSDRFDSGCCHTLSVRRGSASRDIGAPLGVVSVWAGKSCTAAPHLALHARRCLFHKVSGGITIIQRWSHAQSVATLFESISTGDTVIKAVLQTGTMATIAVVLPSGVSWRPSVPSGTRVPQLEVGRNEVFAKLRPPRHSRRLAKGALPSLPPSPWHLCLSPVRHRTYYVLRISSSARPWWQRLVHRHRTVPVSSAMASRGCLAPASLQLPSGIVATQEAGTSNTQPRVWQLVHLLLLNGHAHIHV